MQPSREDRSKYVGIEIECYGPIDRPDLRSLLNEVTSLQGKVQVGTDTSIEPPEEEYTETEEIPSEGDLDIVERTHSTRTLDLAELVYQDGAWQDNRLYTFRSRSRRQARLEDDRYWSNQDHVIMTAPESETLHAYEVRVLCKQSEVTSIVKKVYKVLSDAGCETNESCGLHIHLDMRYRNPMTAYHNLFRCQRMLINLSPEGREGSNWCRTNDERTLLGHISEYSEKYYVINPLCYNRLKTIEIRIGEGTMEPTQVISWVDLLCTIVDNQDELTTSYDDLDSFTDDYDLSKDSSVEVLQEMDRAS